MQDYYKILELSFGAPSSAIKSAYRRLAFQYHPDKNFNDKYAEEKFKEITEAYYILSDDNRRIIYHAEYNDFLNNKYVNRIPDFSNYQKRYHHPTDIPKQPRGPASRYTDNFTSLRIVVFVSFILMIIYLLYQSGIEMKKREQEKEILNEPTAAIKNSDTISEEDFLKIISQEFIMSDDSALLKSNIDSLRHVFDSITHTTKN